MDDDDDDIIIIENYRIMIQHDRIIEPYNEYRLAIIMINMIVCNNNRILENY